MSPAEVRKKFLEFYKARGHAIVPSSSLVPENDPTTLFTGSGMQPLIQYLLGQPHPEGKRVADSQECFRAEDIDEVGDNRHTTFFEMLGNWSFGDYFKGEQLPWIFEFMTKELGLKPENLYVTVFAGDEEAGVPADAESVEIWKKLFKEKGVDAKYAELGSEENGSKAGMQGGRIFSYDVKKNWWSRAGVPSKMPAGEPGGPDSEIFYEFASIGHDPKFGEHCHPNCDCGRFLEIGNSVFMEYKKEGDGSFAKLAQRNVDFGGGLERLTMAANGVHDIIAVNHKEIIEYIEKASGKRYDDDKYSFRVIADHMKAAVFLVSAGVSPAKAERGYFARRLMRRAVRYADRLGMGEKGFSGIVEPIALMYRDIYPEIEEGRAGIQRIISEEEARFRETLARGLNIIRKYYAHGMLSHGAFSYGEELTRIENRITGENLFDLYATHGFPLELSLEEFDELGKEDPGNPLLKYDRDKVFEDFRERMKKHQELSRTASVGMFKGGLADHSEKTTRLHTAHHLLLRALQTILGPSVKQRGSNITSERLRMDFSYDGKMTDEQKKEAERIVNEKIAEDLPVIRSEMPKEDAEKLGAEHEFGQKYPDKVSVYSVGPKEATQDDPRFENAFSIEFCGGPHVAHTGEIGKFKIAKEEAVGAGIRRIRGVIE